MKKKPLLILLLLLFLSYSLYQVYIFYIDTNDNLQPIYLVPKDAVYVIESDKPIDNWSTISKSAIWKHINTNDYFNNLAKNLNKLDTIFKQKQTVFNRIGNRDILISAHVYTPKKYSFFYVIDLQKISKLNLLKSHINTLINSNYTVNNRKYHNHEIIEVFDTKSKETLSISFIKNQMIASYTHTLVEASIDQYLEPEIGRNLNFLEVKKEVAGEDMFRLYFQYKYLDTFVNVFSNKSDYITKTINDGLEFSGFSFDLKNNTIFANGSTNTNAKANTYLKALKKSGKGKRTISKIAPNKTAIYLSFAFSSFDKFYKNFEAIQKEKPEQFISYVEGIEKVENLLKIDVKKHFMSWIDNEIALLQLHSNVSNSKENIALVIKSSDIDDTKKNLNFILQQIKKHTPVKFKTVNYKNYDINFLSIKGFFKVLFGETFKNIEKPYFTIIEDYVIFSNEPNTLKSIINTYIHDETLNFSEDYKSFDDHLTSRSSIYAYVNTPNLYNSAYQFVDIATKKQLKTNKDYFICFPQIGIQLTPKDAVFESKIVINYQDPETVKNNSFLEGINTTTTQNTTNKPIEITSKDLNKSTIFKLPEIYPTDLTADTFVKNYTNGKIKFSVELKDGLKHGKYEEFYPNGKLKITGKYRNDKQVGLWKAYNYKEDVVFKDRL